MRRPKLPHLNAQQLNALEALLGLALVCYGVSYWSGPLALVIAGAALFGSALWKGRG